MNIIWAITRAIWRKKGLSKKRNDGCPFNANAEKSAQAYCSTYVRLVHNVQQYGGDGQYGEYPL